MSYWYCAECERELPGSQVTFEEKCDTCGHPVIWVDTKNDESIDSMLEELKQRRESALRPAAKFLGQDFGQLIGKVCSECDEVIEAWDDDFNQCPEQLPKEAYNDILMELVDVQMACETALAKILPDRADRDEVRRQVIEKNAKRGYYEGAASNK